MAYQPQPYRLRYFSAGQYYITIPREALPEAGQYYITIPRPISGGTEKNSKRVTRSVVTHSNTIAVQGNNHEHINGPIPLETWPSSFLLPFVNSTYEPSEALIGQNDDMVGSRSSCPERVGSWP